LNSRATAAVASVSAPVLASSPSVSAGAVVEQRPAVTPRPPAPLAVAPMAAARMQNSPHRPPPYRESGGRPRFLVPLIVGALFFAAILTVPRLLTHRPEAQTVATGASEKTPGQPTVQKPAQSAASSRPKNSSADGLAVSQTSKPSMPAVPKADQNGTQPTATESLKQTSEKEEPSSAPAPSATPVTAEAAKSGAVGMASSKGEVLDQVLPDVSPKARATIHGRVRVSVRVQVDPSGGVSAAEFDSQGPSKFFADLALQAARKWAFTPPEVNGKSVASEWRLRFVFTANDTKVVPTQMAP